MKVSFVRWFLIDQRIFKLGHEYVKYDGLSWMGVRMGSIQHRVGLQQLLGCL
jgi:hypothetical protein